MMKQEINIVPDEKTNSQVSLFIALGWFLYCIYLISSTSNGKDSPNFTFGLVMVLCFGGFAILNFLIFLQTFKSTFVLCSLDIASKVSVVENIGRSKSFKLAPYKKEESIILFHQKYALGLSYTIYFILREGHFEFNALCDQLGVIDFGTRKRIIRKIKKQIEISCPT